ncbi:MAG: formimidoylglutamase [Bdellovibrionota bacterium]|nr:formimidoylglutamase [Bdellovibrionota bacterium]
MAFKKINKASVFQSRDSVSDPRFGDLINQNKDSEYIIYGYGDDRGVKNNGGRLGAALGPEAIRKILYKMTFSPLLDDIPSITDLGDLNLSKNISEDHNKAIQYLLSKYDDPQKKMISFGGGHDYAYPDGKFFLKRKKNESIKPIIINFDAHLDCRPPERDINSGTPFYRLLTEHPNDFIFIEIGLQKQCNSRTHYQWAKNKGLKSLWLEDILEAENAFDLMKRFLSEELKKTHPCFLSIDLDVFSSSIAPGCSQSWPSGLDFESFWKLYLLILQKWNVMQLGIYECAPNLDIDQRTSRLAARLTHCYII